jgi:two-component sensor histidine kinase
VVVVPHHARGARQARHRLNSELIDTVGPELLADVVAVVGELVGNAIRHARPLPGDVVRLAWRIHADGRRQVVDIRVTDGGGDPETPRERSAGPEAVDGRGLAIVSALADRWGVERDGLGQSVWARLSSTR